MFLVGSGAVALSSLPSGSLWRISVAPLSSPLKRSRFVPALDGSFRFTGGDDRDELTLVEINDLVPVMREADEDRFSLLFRAPRGQPTITSIQTFHNEVIGDVVLFVSPVGRTESVVHYEAVINRS